MKKNHAMLARHRLMMLSIVIAIVVAAFVVIMPEKNNHSPAAAVSASKSRGEGNISTRQVARARKAAGQVLNPVNELTVQFPKATENTITIASESQLVKLDGFRNPLSEDAKTWDCVIDRTTGLVWEVKTADNGLRDEKNYYSWFSPHDVSTLGNPGKKNNGNCRGGISCDTDSYIRAVNKAKLCSYSDWRLPTRKELMSLIHYSPTESSVGLLDARFFPHGTVDWYWTSENDASNPDHAWYVLFFNGRAMKAPKHQAKRIRLVRGGQARSFKDVARNPQTGEDGKVAKDKPAPGSILQSKNETPVSQLQ